MRIPALLGVAALLALASGADAQVVRYDATRGAARSVRFEAGDAPRFQGSPATAAKRFLSEFRGLFNGAMGAEAATGLPDFGLNAFELPAEGEGDEPEAKVYRVDDTEGVSFVRMRQQVRGLEVAGGDLVVAVTPEGTVLGYQGGYAATAHNPFMQLAEFGDRVGEEGALAAAADAVGGEVESQDARLVYHLDQDGALTRAWEVGLSTHRPMGSFQVYVDAEGGQVLEVRDLMMSSGHQHRGNVSDGRGQVYMVNPLRDENLHPVILPRLDGSGTLTGEFAKVRNGKHDDLTDPQGNFVVEVESPHFAEAQAYFHADRIHDNLKRIDPSFTGMDRQVPVTVHSPGNIWVKKDNAYYDPRRKALFILDPDKLNDLHLEPGVMYHEYHHATTDAIVPGLWSVEGKAMHEGYADYFACSLTEDPVLGEWALKPLNRPGMRNLTSDRHYPEDLHPQREPHSDGEIWAAACWTLRSKVGRETADFLVHRSRFYLSSNATFYDAYQGMLAADRDFRAGAHQDAIREVFEARGIAGGTAAVAEDPTDPRPAARRTIFDVMLARR